MRCIARGMAFVIASITWIALAVVPVDAHPPVTKACKDCHADKDVHRGELADRDCGTCHTLAAWLPSTFAVAQHLKYPLDGRHTATPCGGCHGPRPRASFVIPQQDCLDCHQNPHGTELAEQQQTLGCAGCHGTGNWKAWKATAAGPLDHASWPIDGAHAQVSCAACHPGKPATAPASAYRGVPRDCAKCHDDLHAGQFAASKTPALPQRDCTSCHTSKTFRGAFDHATTRYTLDGAHVGMACAKCHPQTQLRNGDTSIRWRLGYATCRDCHANPHPSVAMECSTCHSSSSWRGVTGATGFDHAKTGFALRGAHARASCGGCHGGSSGSSGSSGVGSSGMGSLGSSGMGSSGVRPPTECEGCHRDPHQGRVAGVCAECHRETAWSDTSMLERHRRTRMPLTGAHARIDCAACHRRQGDRAWSELPVDCFACHANGYRNATAPDHDGANPLPRDCARCHVTVAWSPAIDPSALARRTGRDHDAWFVLSGSHRAADCGACHVGSSDRRTRDVRCDGCHTTAKLRTQHVSPVSTAAKPCLQCHPRGSRR